MNECQTEKKYPFRYQFSWDFCEMQILFHISVAKLDTLIEWTE